MLKISNCNATGPYTFSKAFCQTERYRHEHRIIHNSEIVKKFSFSSIFKYGEELLTSYVKPRNESRLPQKKGARLAFAKLLHFLSNELPVYRRSVQTELYVATCIHELLAYTCIYYSEMRMYALINNAVVKHKVPVSFHLFSDAKRSLMKIKCGAQESDCTFILAHHLLSKLALAVSSFYKMDSGYKTQQFTCMHVPASVVNIPVGYIVILALVCFIQTHPNLTTN